MQINNLHINQTRLWDSLMEMAKIGATEKGGCNRLALTDLDKQARELFITWCEAAGCAVAVDQVGNMFATRPGRNNDLPPVGTGSHLDTQPTGGKFDGVFGVLAGLEVLRTLQDHDIQTDAPIEVSVWTNEEGSRFPPAMMGSGVVSGRLDLQTILQTKDVDGLSFGDELKRIGFAGELSATRRAYTAFFETHIEQGPYLENEDKTIGIVTGGQGQRWYTAILTGRESHAGTTPMHLRKDALIAASHLILEVEEIANRHEPGCGTVGFLQVYPNSRNTIPGQITMGIDLRHPVDAILSEMDEELNSFVANLKKSVDLDLDPYWYYAPVKFDTSCIDAVREGAKIHGLEAMDIIAGAGHDACYVNDYAPTSMIFTPCKDGISHNEIESTTSAECAAGANVLLHAMTNMAGVL
jgi:N-carbamoyl-L-amino-acid hydrolase